MEIRNLTDDEDIEKVVIALLNNYDKIDMDYPKEKQEAIQEAWDFLEEHPKYSWGKSREGLPGREKKEILNGKKVIAIWETGGFDGVDYGTISPPR